MQDDAKAVKDVVEMLVKLGREVIVSLFFSFKLLIWEKGRMDGMDLRRVGGSFLCGEEREGDVLGFKDWDWYMMRK